jgi:hypothetical protein
MSECRLCQIVNKNVHESFYRLKTKVVKEIRKQRTKLFVSRPFKDRTKGRRYGRIIMKHGNFDLQIWYEIRLKLFQEVDDVRRDQ